MVVRARGLSAVVAIALASAAAAPAALAAPPASDDSKIHRLDLKPSADIASGRIAIVQSEAGADPDRYVVEGLTMLQPVEVLVVTRERADDVKCRSPR